MLNIDCNLVYWSKTHHKLNPTLPCNVANTTVQEIKNKIKSDTIDIKKNYFVNVIVYCYQLQKSRQGNWCKKIRSWLDTTSINQISMFATLMVPIQYVVQAVCVKISCILRTWVLSCARNYSIILLVGKCINQKYKGFACCTVFILSNQFSHLESYRSFSSFHPIPQPLSGAFLENPFDVSFYF